MRSRPRFVAGRLPFLVVILVAAMALFSGCATTSQPARAPTEKDLPFVFGTDGHRMLLVRESVDLEKRADGDERVAVQYLWDYTDGIAVRRSFKSDGSLRDSIQLPAVTLNATEQEREFAFSMVRKDRRLAALITDDTKIYGGFSFREPGHRDCDRRSRCIHVVGSADDGRRHVLHAIVDLMSGRVVDPAFDPQMRGIDQDSEPREK